MTNTYKTVGLWLILITLFVAFYNIFSEPQEVSQTLTWQAVQSLVADGQVSRLDVAMENGRGIGHGNKADGTRFNTDSRSGRDFAELEARGVVVDYTERPPSLWSSIVVQWLPIVFLFLFFIFFMRQLRGKGTKVLDFTVPPERITGPVKLNGLTHARARLQAAARAARDGTSGPRRILVTGAPGTGKTTLLKAVAADTGLALLACPGSVFVEVFVGVGAARVRKLFECATAEAPCIAAIDDLDAFATRRTLPDAKVDERATTMLELANRLDGLATFPPKVLFVATTSRPDLLDEAISRAGRFQLRIDLRPGGESTIEELEA